MDSCQGPYEINWYLYARVAAVHSHAISDVGLNFVGLTFGVEWVLLDIEHHLQKASLESVHKS